LAAGNSRELFHACKECTVVSKLSESEPKIGREVNVAERFHRLAAEWKEQSRFLSNSAQMAMLRPYQQIIGMGPVVVPLKLDELRREPDQWFWALESITEQNPVSPEAMGKVRLMAQAWVEWGKRQGMIGNET
jgi:hypothetical protein